MTALAMIIGAARTVFVRMANAKALEAGATERAVQYVKTALPTTPTAGQTLSLPGTLQGFVQSPISARASGYLKRWTKDIGTLASRLKISANRPLTNYNAINYETVQNDFALSLTASYELDLAGRVQRTVEGANASGEQSAADLENTRLLLAADLATHYFNPRSTDTELDVLARSIALQRRALELVTARHDLGAVSGLDVAQQQALLDSTLTQVDVLRKQRSQYEHAIATLTGTRAPTFTLAPDIKPITPPAIPIGVPSETLQRRPDVASAERAVAAANAQIGVATAAFYPSITLAPTVGVDSRLIRTLFDPPSLLWSIDLSAAQPLFDGGRLRANLAFSKTGFDATVANHRRVVLVAMQEAEDGIRGLSALDRATTQAGAAVAAARRVLDMSMARCEGGASTYLDVITAQQSLLTTERQAAQLMVNGSSPPCSLSRHWAAIGSKPRASRSTSRTSIAIFVIAPHPDQSGAAGFFHLNASALSTTFQRVRIRAGR